MNDLTRAEIEALRNDYTYLIGHFGWAEKTSTALTQLLHHIDLPAPANARIAELEGALESLSYIHDSNPSDAMADKPADRLRAAHKLDLRDGDVVELVKWQPRATNQNLYVGTKYTVNARGEVPLGVAYNPKGFRPLFRVTSRAADARPKPDEVIVRYTREDKSSAWYFVKYIDCVNRFTITFPHGSDVGTVIRERL